MPSHPLVSVIMPAYNAAAYVAHAIGSVQAQTYPHWELLVVDDGSTDETAAVVQQLAATDSRIHYLYQANGRQAKARNNGIAHAHGTLLALLDADDAWMPGKLETQVQELEETGADLVFGPYVVVDEAGNALKTITRTRQVFSGNQGLLAFLEGNMIMTSSALMRTEAFNRAGGFEVEKAPVEDLVLWLHMLLQGCTFLRSDRVLSYYRRHSAQSSAADLHLSSQALDAIRGFSFSPEIMSALRSRIYPAWYTKMLRANKGCNRQTMNEILFAVARDCGSFPALSFARTLNQVGATGIARQYLEKALAKKWKGK